MACKGERGAVAIGMGAGRAPCGEEGAGRRAGRRRQGQGSCGQEGPRRAAGA